MAFVKRTWLARIGTGLNKFFIGEKDANDKQTLVNSPDSVTQQGDVISAENLNDLEDRIDDAFNEKADITYVNGLKLKKVWESTPSASFEAQTVELNTSKREFIIETRITWSVPKTFFLHIRIAPSGTPSGGYCTSATWTFINIYGSNSKVITTYSRGIDGYINSNNKAQIVFNDNFDYSYSELNTIPPTDPTTTFVKDNGGMIPVAIYEVGDIYTT